MKRRNKLKQRKKLLFLLYYNKCNRNRFFFFCIVLIPNQLQYLKHSLYTYLHISKLISLKNLLPIVTLSSLNKQLTKDEVVKRVWTYFIGLNIMNYAVDGNVFFLTRELRVYLVEDFLRTGKVREGTWEKMEKNFRFIFMNRKIPAIRIYFYFKGLISIRKTIL